MQLDRSAVDGIPLWMLVRAAHAAERHLAAALAGLELSPVQFGVLSQLAVEPATQAELARLCLVRPQTVAGVVDGLEARGLVARSGQPRKGRRNPLALTRTGDELLGRAWPVVVAANEPSRVGLEPAGEAALREQLARLLLTLG